MRHHAGQVTVAAWLTTAGALCPTTAGASGYQRISTAGTITIEAPDNEITQRFSRAISTAAAATIASRPLTGVSWRTMILYQRSASPSIFLNTYAISIRTTFISTSLYCWLSRDLVSIFSNAEQVTTAAWLTTAGALCPTTAAASAYINSRRHNNRGTGQWNYSTGHIDSWHCNNSKPTVNRCVVTHHYNVANICIAAIVSTPRPTAFTQRSHRFRYIIGFAMTFLFLVTPNRLQSWSMSITPPLNVCVTLFVPTPLLILYP